MKKQTIITPEYILFLGIILIQVISIFAMIEKQQTLESTLENSFSGWREEYVKLNERMDNNNKLMESALLAINGDYDDYVNYRMNHLSEYEESEIRTVGYYNYDGFYCVQTAGRDNLSIKKTEGHELCHYFIDMDKGHFCNNTNQTNYTLSEEGKDLLVNYVKGSSE